MRCIWSPCIKQKAPRALDRSTESCPMKRWCIGICLKRSHLKIFIIIFSPSGHVVQSSSPFVWWCATICAILVKGIMRNNSVKLFWIWTSGLGADVVKNILSRGLAAPVYAGADPLVQFWWRVSRDTIVKLYWIWTSMWFTGKSRLKYFLSRFLAALMFHGAKPFKQMW